LDQKLPKHVKIRFRRGDISELHTFPSAAGHGRLMRGRGMGGRILAGIATTATVLTSIAVIGAVLIYVVVTTGIGTDRLGDEAEAAIRSFSGLDVEASLGPARVSVDRSQFLAVSVPDVRLKSRQDGAPLLDAGTIDFGVRALPLLSGNIQLGSARITNARLYANAFAAGGSTDWSAVVENGDGLVDPDLIAPAVFGAVHQLFDAVRVGSTRAIELDNVEIVLAPDAAVRGLNIDQASLALISDGEMQFAADIEVDGRAVAIDGSARRDAASKRIAELKLEISAGAPMEPETVSAVIEQSSAEEASAPVGNVLGPVARGGAGADGAHGSPSKLTLTGSLGRSTFAIDKTNYLEGEVKLAASIATGENKVRVERLEITQDRSSYVLYGPVGPRPVASGEPPVYRFELGSDRSVSAPAGSTEPALDFSAMIAGTYDPVARKLDVPTVEIRTGSGSLAAGGSVEFVSGKPPGVDLAVTVPELAISDVKQLWPFTAAGKARYWAMNNLFDGRLTNGQIRYRVAPGRIGNGVPLSGDEVSGHVEISGARFDITGSIPPMRDAAAAIDFRGNDVDVAFKAGAVFMPDGRSVAADDGTFTIRDAYKEVVVGQLEVNVAGDAASVARLASYEPIDGLRSTGMAPDDFSGEVWGHVSTQIPLVGGLDMKDLAWQVSLDYDDLALAKPIEDQLVTEAVGNITLDPDKAVVKAKARLNGAPAEIAMVEPLRASGPEASRDVSIVLDDEAREEIAPGLGMLVEGPAKVSFTSGANGERQVKADLTQAELKIPWVGWSKGSGIAAGASFTLGRSGDTTRLSDFKLSGKSFAISGDVTLADGGLAGARFGSVQLNRGDDVSVSIKRAGKGFDISIKGDTLDARPLIKLLKAESESGEGSGGKRPISVEARIGRLAGFHDEVLSDVTVVYRGIGSTVVSAKAEGATSSGASFSVEDRTEDGIRAHEARSADAGALLRFLDIYEHMIGGTMKFAVSGPADGTLSGQVDAVNFQVVNERKIGSLVSSAPEGNRSLNQAVKREIDTSRVTFERGFALISKGKAGIELNKGVLRGPVIGSTFRGVLRDREGRIDMTGTFMPAYGINRIFGEIPLVGAILGNGRDGGLIGVTFKLTGDADSPTLTVNPLSAIAPGIFRSIFEFR
jgi:hypothetical protein